MTEYPRITHEKREYSGDHQIRVTIKNPDDVLHELSFLFTHEGLIVDAEDTEGQVTATMSIMYDELEEGWLR